MRLKQVGMNEVEILVVDNSTIETKNEENCKKQGVRYISMNGNKGLSKAYNAAIDNSSGKDVIVLLDDDTEITEEYFTELTRALKDRPDVDIFAPIVYGQDGIIYSPNEFHFLRNHFIKKPDEEISQRNFNAIASCLAIRMNVFDSYRFNEKLFVDQVDQYFFCEQREKGRKFGILPLTIQQNFYQRASELQPEAGWKRLRLRIRDIMVHARLMRGFQYKILGYIKCCGLGVQIGRRTRSLKVLIKACCLSTILLFKMETQRIE